MLIDEVLAHKGFSELVRRMPSLESLRTAHAFVMTEDAENAANHLLKTSKTSRSIVDQFRLPYPVCWVEEAVVGGKVGVYLDGRFESPAGLVFLACIGRHHEDQKIGSMGVQAVGVFNPETLQFLDEEGGRSFAISCSPTEEMRRLASNAEHLLINAAVMAMSAIAIVNSPAVSSTELSDLTKLNRQRTKRGKPALVDYHTVHIRPAVARQLRVVSESGDEEEGCRLHWRRGH